MVTSEEERGRGEAEAGRRHVYRSVDVGRSGKVANKAEPECTRPVATDKKKRKSWNVARVSRRVKLKTTVVDSATARVLETETSCG